MKNVLIDFNRLRDNANNGLFQFSDGLAKAFSSLNSIENDLQFTFYLPKNKFGNYGNKVKYLNHNSIDKFYKFGTGKFDVWHITTQISWYRPFNKKTKSIFTIHDLNFLIEEKDNLKRNKRLLADIQKRIDRSHFITAISAFAMQTIEQNLILHNIPRAVVHNGAYLSEYPNFNTPKYQPTKPFLFSIGMVQPRKNFHSLMPLLLQNDFELVIAGTNTFEYKNCVLNEAKKIGVLDRVKLIGEVTEDEKFWYYKNCLAFLFPSVAEGFGLPIIEAMQLGKPVFLSKETCLPEIGGDAAYYFTDFSKENMQQIFNDGMHHYLTTQPQESIKQRATKFSWNNAVKKYIEIYKKI